MSCPGSSRLGRDTRCLPITVIPSFTVWFHNRTLENTVAELCFKQFLYEKYFFLIIIRFMYHQVLRLRDVYDLVLAV